MANYWLGNLDENMVRLKKEMKTLDLVFMSHKTGSYLKDLKHFEFESLFVKGTIIIADNPDFSYL